MQHRRTKTGFTIVELLIVIVVIAILVVISVVAYTGIQDRARYASYQTDITSINKAIMMYAMDNNGTYPVNADPLGSCVTNAATGTGNFIIGLTPTYIQKIPDVPYWSGGQNYYIYCWSADGTDYKILRAVPVGPLPGVELSGNTVTDPNRGTRAWGYWSEGGAAL